jgi:SAM-dependent MidA family methyltransferase
VYAVANEFFDALPIRQFVRTAAGWQERYLQPIGGDGIDWQVVLQKPHQPPAFPDLAEGSLWEASPLSLAVMQELAARLRRNGGAAAVIDYGYEGPAAGETLQAVRDHQPWPVFKAPGEADLSAHVDFGALAAAARAAGCATQLQTQAAFLHHAGIETRLMQLLASTTPAQKEALVAGYRRLTAAGEMGMLFKVLSVTASCNKKTT